MAPLTFLLPAAFSFLLRAAATDDKPTCAYVEIVRKTETHDTFTEFRAPGHCERVVGAKNPRSRRFNCYSGCGGTKLQYQEFNDNHCQGDMVVDTMLHRKQKEETEGWSTGPQAPETFLMEMDLGAVRDFDCSLAFCYVMETRKDPTETPIRHVPADRISCSTTQNGNHQWTRCLSDGRLAVFENAEGCDVPQEPEVLATNDSGEKSMSGVVREWDCEGYEGVEEDDEADFAPHVLAKARMVTHKSAQARREQEQAARVREKSPESNWLKVVVIIFFLACPVLVLALRTEKATPFKNMLPRWRSQPKYSGLGQRDEFDLDEDMPMAS